MKVRLVFVRSCTAQYSEYEYTMEKQCKTVDVELPITNDDASKKLKYRLLADRWV